jgi:hypothetical protein
MTKNDFYNSLLGLYKETGQGLVLNLLRPTQELMNIIDSLIAENLVKKVIITYNHLPDDVFICPVGYYCVEEEKNTSMVLTFIRNYLNVADGIGLNIKLDSIEHSDIYPEYLNWIEKNKSELEKIRNIQPVLFEETDEPTTPTIFLNEDVYEYLKTLTPYNKNISVKEFFNIIEELSRTLEELISLKKKRLERTSTNNEELSNDLNTSKEEFKIVKNIFNLIKSEARSEEPIQALLKII